jgi:trehalose synthase
MLAGPDVAAVTDDPEGAAVLEEVQKRWEALDPAARARVHLAWLPMEDGEENAAIVNALQRHATLVVQKSLAEGFGLTVSEALWKARPVVGSRVGGIQDQIEHGVDGVLVDDPRDTEAFGAAVADLLADPERCAEMGERGREKVREHFLESRHLAEWVDLLGTLSVADQRR